MGILADDKFSLKAGNYELEFVKCVESACFKAGTEESCIKVASDKDCSFEKINFETEYFPEHKAFRVKRLTS